GLGHVCREGGLVGGCSGAAVADGDVVRGAESSVREVVAGDVLDGPPERVRVEEDRADDALLGLEGWRGARPAHRYRHCSVMRCWSGTAEDGRAVSGWSSHRSPFSQ